MARLLDFRDDRRHDNHDNRPERNEKSLPSPPRRCIRNKEFSTTTTCVHNEIFVKHIRDNIMVYTRFVVWTVCTDSKKNEDLPFLRSYYATVFSAVLNVYYILLVRTQQVRNRYATGTQFCGIPIRQQVASEKIKKKNPGLVSELLKPSSN